MSTSTPGGAAHEQYAELAAGYALSALEPAEEQHFLAHLAGCARCEQDVREHTETMAHLAYAADAPEPPVELLDNIRAAVLASGRGASFAFGAADANADGIAPDHNQTTPAPVSLADARHRRTARLRRGSQLVGAAAAAALVLGLGVWNSDLRTQSDNQRTRSDALVAAVVNELGVDDTRPVSLRDGDGRAVAVALVHGADMAVLHDGLAVNAPDTTYVLWGRVGVEMRAVGAFDVTGDEAAVTRGLRLPGDIGGLSELMVTQEQGRVAPRVPGAPVLASGTI